MIGFEDSIREALQPLYSEDAWLSSKQIVRTTIGLLVMSEGLSAESICPSQKKTIRKIFALIKNSELPPRLSQKKLVDAVVEKVFTGLNKYTPSGRFPGGDAEMLATIVNTQVRLLRENITIIKGPDSKEVSLDPSSKEDCLAAFRFFGWAVLLASPNFSHDEDYALAALSSSLIAASFFGETLFHKHKFLHSALRINGLFLYFLSAYEQQRLCLVADAVEQNGRALQYGTVETRSLRPIVWRALFSDESAREFVGPSLRDDVDMSLATVAGLIHRGKLFPHSGSTSGMIPGIRERRNSTSVRTGTPVAPLP